MRIRVSKVAMNDNELPMRMSEGASGFDLYASIDTVLQQDEIRVVPTGIAIEIPAGYEGQVRARSSLAVRGVMLTNGVGTIDSDYRGEIGVILTNLTTTPFVIEAGDRIAQLVIVKLPEVTLEEVPYIELTETDRGFKGFGSTGV